MLELNDSVLLKEYVEHGSDEAFATLVARHVNKVYSVALRHTRNAHQAEEITQAVFVILARKSRRLGKRVILSGWLCRTARLAAVIFIRSEIRRARREQEACMQNLLNDLCRDYANLHVEPGRCPGRPGPVFGCPGRVQALSGLCPGLAGAPLIAARNVSDWGQRFGTNWCQNRAARGPLRFELFASWECQPHRRQKDGESCGKDVRLVPWCCRAIFSVEIRGVSGLYRPGLFGRDFSPFLLRLLGVGEAAADLWIQ